MKQVLFVSAGQEFPQGPFSLLRMMQRDERIHAKALFFKPIDYATLAAVTAGSRIGPVLALEERENETVAAHKTQFARQCEQHYITFTIHDNAAEWQRDLLIKESRFADLLVISGELFYADAANGQPNGYLHDALHHAECPVVIVPENFHTIEHLYMAYDASRESLYALKQFCYLFPQLTALPAAMIYLNEEASDDIPDIDHFKQFSRLKFECLGCAKLHFKPSEYLSTWLSEKKEGLLISGSFGRSSLSYLTKPSFADAVIREHQLPVFIAHH
jgi:hypothetical protein